MNEPLLRQADGRFVTGNIGGPGRPPGSRNAVSEAFLRAYEDDFKKHGASTIREVRAIDPVAYVKIGALLASKIDSEGAQATGVTVVNVITGWKQKDRDGSSD